MVPLVIAARMVGSMVVVALRTLQGAFVSVAVSMGRFAKSFEGAGRVILRSGRTVVRGRKSALPKKFPHGSDDWIDLDLKSKRSWDALTDMPERIDAVTRMTPYIAAAETYWGLMSRVPGGPRYGGYRKSLKLVRVGPKRQRFGDFAVVGTPKNLKDRSIDSARNVIYVRPKKTFTAPVSKAVRVLHKFSPWTMETLPFSPRKNEAVLVLRRVSKREVQSITRQRNKDRPEWRKQLEAAGIRNIRVGEKPPELKTSVVQDLGFDALRLEFGYGGIKPVPHWRPAISESLQLIKRLYKQRGLFSKTLTDPKFKAWRKWPPRTESTIKSGDLRAIRKFQKRLQIRVSS